MIETTELVKIARKYIETVTRKEGDIFPDYFLFEKGIVFNYQNKEFIKSGERGKRWLGCLQPFIVSKSNGLIYHLFKSDNSEKELIRKFLSNKIKGISLS
jgi:hypothetical protein